MHGYILPALCLGDRNTGQGAGIETGIGNSNIRHAVRAGSDTEIAATIFDKMGLAEYRHPISQPFPKVLSPD
jgi:hypothetical protein